MTWNPTAGTKPCGCGPLAPCAVHRDTGEVLDWEGRARAAEDRLAGLAALSDPAAIPDDVVNAAMRADCLGRSPWGWQAVPSDQARRLIAGAVAAVTGSEGAGNG